jgi:hypothetical protein
LDEGVQCVCHRLRKARIAPQILSEYLAHAQKGRRQPVRHRTGRISKGAQALGKGVAYVNRAALLINR